MHNPRGSAKTTTNMNPVMKKPFAAALALTAFAAWADDAALITETRMAALAIPPKLLQMVQDEIDKGSYHGAIAPPAATRRRKWPRRPRRAPAGRSAASA